jgi:hypothetical protein
MRKLLALILLPLWAYAQTPSGLSNQAALSQWPIGGLKYWPTVSTHNLQLFGQYDNATADSVIANDATPPAIMGTTADQLAAQSFAHTEAVGFYSHILAPAAVVFSVGAYTTTTFTPVTPYTAPQIAQMHVGMWVLTCSSATIPCPDANFFWGQATAFSSTTITVSGWFQQGNSSPGQNPSSSYCANGSTCYAVVSPIGAVWSMNTACRLTSSSYANQCYGYELDMHDQSGHSSDALYGFDVVQQGNVDVDSAFMTSTGTANGFKYGYHYRGANETAGIDPTDSAFFSSQGAGVSFKSSQTAGDVVSDLATMTSGNYLHFVNFFVSFNSIMDLGNHSGASSPQIRLHDSGHSAADATISSSGGAGANDGTITLSASTGTIVSGPLTEPVILFASLGTCAVGNKGQGKIITDGANTPTYAATTTGGGSTLIRAICNGTNWTNH